MQAPHVFAQKLIPQEYFPACIGFVPGGITNPGTTPITILAVDSDHGLSFGGEEARTMV